MKKSKKSHPYILQSYEGFGNAKRYSIKGRVLENENILKEWSDSKIRNLLESWKRIETDEIAGAKVGLSFKGLDKSKKDDFYQEVVTDEEGYFHFEGEWKLMKTAVDRWETMELNLIEPSIPLMPLKSNTQILLPPKNSEYGIISDMDDTVLQTHATSRLKLKMLYVSFAQGAHQRLPMEGMKSLLKKMTKGKNNTLGNPIFYVSNSPWNIYDILYNFIKIQKLPRGPLLLRDYGPHLIFKSKKHVPHKLQTMRHILNTYPKLPFVCLGDTASRDADYYLQMEKEFPGRIQAIYIRQTKATKNARRIRTLLKESGNPNYLVVHSAKEIKDHFFG